MSGREYFNHTTHLAIAAPAVRMVAVHAHAYRPTGDEPRDPRSGLAVAVDLVPVVAIRSQVSVKYWRPAPEDSRTTHAKPASLDPQHLLLEGFRRHEETVEDTALVLSRNFGLIGLDALAAMEGGPIPVAVCPWPPEEDEARLAPMMEAAKAWAIGGLQSIDPQVAAKLESLRAAVARKSAEVVA